MPSAAAASPARHAAASIPERLPAEHPGDGVGARFRVRLGQHAREARAHRVVEGHDQRGGDIVVHQRGQRALHPVDHAPFDVLAHERVQPEL